MNNKAEDEKFPEYLMIRDTKLHDDMGGSGRRIYTTAGQGYKKVRYIRADLCAEVAREAMADTVANMTDKQQRHQSIIQPLFNAVDEVFGVSDPR